MKALILILTGLVGAVIQVAAEEPPQSLSEYPPGGAKRVVIDKTNQVLRAYEGNHEVMETRVSTGRHNGSTPNGHFTAGDKSLMHYSHLFDNAPMPYSVHLGGNVFIHGFSSVPAYPASHGCIRVPLTHGNPAKQFYDWVDPGTPVTILGASR